MLMMRSKGIAVIYRLREGKERPLLTKGKCASAEVPLCLSQCPGHRKDSCLLRQQIPKCFSKPKFTTARNIWQMAIYSLS